MNFWATKNSIAYTLRPFSWAFRLVTYLRYRYYQFKGTADFGVPIIVVGNITTGGTGKTPLVAWLAQLLIDEGFTPGIVSRGYGGQYHPKEIVIVDSKSNVEKVGDEPFLLAEKTNCPVAVGRCRPKTVAHLLNTFKNVNIIISDDGLQHYPLRRDIEIAVVDGQKRYGNGFCLPAGPLREPQSRLKRVDFIIAKGQAHKNEWLMKVHLSEHVKSLYDAQTRLLSDFKGKKVHAVAGIGHPAYFFEMLREKGLDIITHVFKDHHVFTQADLLFKEKAPILMTEKDAVKCRLFSIEEAWVVPLAIELPLSFSENLLGKIPHGQKVT